MRFITFAENLTATTKNPWLHEVLFYLGRHPQTGESGIIMMEREMLFDDVFVTPGPENTQYLVLAKDVSYLNFRYYKSRKMTPEELAEQADNPAQYQYIDEWVSQVPLSYTGNIAGASVEDPQSKISSPRAVEISIGLKEQPIPGRTDEPKMIYLPPMTVPLNAGVQIERPPQRVQNENS